MKKFYFCTIMFVALALSLTAFTSCEFDASEEPDYPSYVTYTITAYAEDEDAFAQNDSVLIDIKDWIKTNQQIYDTQVSYSTGAASEFAKSDGEALTKYETFAANFKTYIQSVKAKLAAGGYDKGGVTPTLNTGFIVFANRTQGQDGKLKSERVELKYPD